MEGGYLSKSRTEQALKDSAQKHPDIAVVMGGLLDIYLGLETEENSCPLRFCALAGLLHLDAPELRGVLSGWETILDIPENDCGYIKLPRARGLLLQEHIDEAFPRGEEHARILKGCIKIVGEWDGTKPIIVAMK
jgi:hypothetical protein